MTDPDLRKHLTSLGAPLAESEDLENDGLIGLAGDLQLAAGLDRSIDDAARHAGCSSTDAQAIYQKLGLRVDELAGFGDGDIGLLALATTDPSGMVGEIGPPLLRVTGSILARLAEATVAAYVQDIEPRGNAANDLIAMADQNAYATALAITLGDQLPTIFRHHMWTAVRRQRAAQEGVAHPEIVRLAIGFVDLVGFTSLSNAAAPADLIATIEDFETRAFDASSRHGGRVVKSIGDEVMIAARDATVVAAIALDLIANSGDDPSVAPRGGISAGDVLFRLGDYYGPVVNLASRLAAEAVPGEVLADQAASLTPGLAVQPAGRRTLKGFAEPVPVWTIESAEPPELSR